MSESCRSRRERPLGDCSLPTEHIRFHVSSAGAGCLEHMRSPVEAHIPLTPIFRRHVPLIPYARRSGGQRIGDFGRNIQFSKTWSHMVRDKPARCIIAPCIWGGQASYKLAVQRQSRQTLPVLARPLSPQLTTPAVHGRSNGVGKGIFAVSYTLRVRTVALAHLGA